MSKPPAFNYDDYRKLEEARRWRRAGDELPPEGESVLVICSGHVGSVTLINTMEFATWWNDGDFEGWELENYPECSDLKVSHWRPMPEWPEECREDGEDE